MLKTGARLTSAVLVASMIVPAGPANAQAYLQCAPFARMLSGVDLFGRAASWWQQAVGRYEKGSLPQAGSVLVFKAISSMRSGHVATVSRVVSGRVIEVTHANWSVIRGRRGQIERDVQVVDVSPANDWSQVRVWWAPQQGLGTTAYPTYGFIYARKAARAAAPNPATLLLATASVARTATVSLLTGRTAILPRTLRPAVQWSGVPRRAVAMLRPPAPQPTWSLMPMPIIAPPAPPAAAAPERLIALR